MKTLLISLALSLAALNSLEAQTSTDEFNREVQYYEALTVKLYPDCAVADSPLVRMMNKIDAVMKANQSQIYHLSSKPIVEAAAAASLLKIQPHWEAVTEGERNIAFDMITVGLLTSQDLKPTTVTQSQPPAQQPFNPGSMNGDATAAPAPVASASGEATDPSFVPTRKGFLYFYNNLVNQGAGMTGHGRGMDEPKYKAGPLQGKTEGEGRVYAEQQWAQMSRDQQIACEQNANVYGPGPDPDAPSTEHVYNFTPNGMGGGTITGH